MSEIKRALLSVYRKEGLLDLAHFLRERGVELLSTGGTCRLLKESGIAVRDVSEYTGFPEMLDGRVKTLHPRIHGGLLAIRDNPAHQAQMKAYGIEGIDLAVVNLYPFRETIIKPGVTLEEAIENIDIGGPAMLRSAAKNYNDVAVVVDPADYADLIEEMKISNGTLSPERRFALAQKVFFYTSEYDRAIFSYLSSRGGSPERFPDLFLMPYEKIQTLRYGENPHQHAALYRDSGGDAPPRQLWGKEMSYNNFLDADAALSLANEFSERSAVIVKHNNPCGVAMGRTLAEAYKKAKATDPVSAFGGVVAVNGTLDVETAEEIAATFMEVVIAASIDPDALARLKRKKDLRVLEAQGSPKNRLHVRCVAGGLLVQDQDGAMIVSESEWKVVSRRPPTEEEKRALLFAWKVAKHVKSNAIVFAREEATVGIGAGQMSRVDSVKLAIMKAQGPTAGSAMASDAFFPFRDGIDVAAQAGITAVIQPGGSIRDAEVIQAADEHNMAMVTTGVRHFRH